MRRNWSGKWSHIMGYPSYVQCTCGEEVDVDRNVSAFGEGLNTSTPSRVSYPCQFFFTRLIQEILKIVTFEDLVGVFVCFCFCLGFGGLFLFCFGVFFTSCVLFSLSLSAVLADVVVSCASSMLPNLTEIDVSGSTISAFLLSFLTFSAPQYCGFVHEIIEQLVSLCFRLSHS